VALPHGAEAGFDPYQGYADLHADNFFAFTHGVIRPPDAEGEWAHRCFCDAFGLEAKSARAGEAFCRLWELRLNPDDAVGHRWDNRGTWQALEGHRKAARRWFDVQYYGMQALRARLREGERALRRLRGDSQPASSREESDDQSGRVIFVCFMRAATIVLERLLEVNGWGSSPAAEAARPTSSPFDFRPASAGRSDDGGQADKEGVVVVVLPWADTIAQAGSAAEVREARAAGRADATRESLHRTALLKTYQNYARIFPPREHCSSSTPPLPPVPRRSSDVASGEDARVRANVGEGETSFLT
jgi:hypothetical protein